MEFFTTLLFWRNKNIDYTGLAAEFFISSGIDISPQAVLKKVKKAPAFFEALAQKAIVDNKFLHQAKVINIDGVREIFLADSSVIGLRSGLAKAFPGVGTKGTEAAAKLHVLHNLSCQRLSRITITNGITSDHSEKAAHLETMEAGDLIIRDLGYFDIKDLQAIDKKRCYFLTRIPSNIKHYAEKDGKAFDIWAKLASVKENYFEQNLTIGSENKLSARIVAIRLPRNKRKEREKKLLKKKKKRPLTPTEVTQAQWNLFATNMSSSQAPQETVHKLYASRWQIELIFKAWKSNLHIDQVKSAMSAPIVLALIWARLLLAILMMLVRSTIEAEARKEIGVLVWHRRVATQLERIRELVRRADFVVIAEILVHLGLKYCCQSMRKRKTTLTRVVTSFNCKEKCDALA